VKAVLEGHTGDVNCAEFCPHYTCTLVSASDDRTFRVRTQSVFHAHRDET